MTGKTDGRRSLRVLLDRLFDEQKQDIYAYSGGHLNESKLFKPPSSSSSGRSCSWNSSGRKVSSRKKLSTDLLSPTPPPPPAVGQMQKSLINFAVHFDTGRRNSGDVVVSSMPSSSTEATVGQLESGTVRQPKNATVRQLKSVTDVGRKIDGTTTRRKEPTFSNCTPTSRTRLTSVSAGAADRRIVPLHLESITKREQFRKMKDYEANVLRVQDDLQKGVVTGRHGITHLENELEGDLNELDRLGYGPGFHRLRVYSNTFDRLIDESQTFGGILKTIKKEYDDYLSYLIKRPVDRHKILQDQLNQISDMNLANSAAIKVESDGVREKEERAKELLEENERLRAELKKELALASLPEPEVPKPAIVRAAEHGEPSERIERLNREICEILDATKKLRDKIRRECVTTTVCNYLRRSLKETNVEIRQLTSQKQYYEQNLQELEKDLREAIETADTTERDAKRIWKKLEAQTKTRLGHRIGTAIAGGKYGTSVSKRESEEGDDEDEDDSTKWNWYIS